MNCEQEQHHGHGVEKRFQHQTAYFKQPGRQQSKRGDDDPDTSSGNAPGQKTEQQTSAKDPGRAEYSRRQNAGLDKEEEDRQQVNLRRVRPLREAASVELKEEG